MCVCVCACGPVLRGVVRLVAFRVCVWWISALLLVAFRALAQSLDLLGVLRTN